MALSLNVDCYPTTALLGNVDTSFLLVHMHYTSHVTLGILLNSCPYTS